MLEYELMSLFSPEIPEKQIKDETGQINKIISLLNGKIIQEDYWGLKKLAYPIKHFEQGYYHLTWFKLSKNKILELDKKLKTLPKLLRFLITIPEKKKLAILEPPKKKKAPRQKEIGKAEIKKKEGKLKLKKEEKREKRGKKEKVNLKDLDKKLEEILGEEVI